MKKNGQSIIEYVLIAVLVILGIVVMGGYVLRSVSAHFKLWDEGVQDSFQETLTQVNQSYVPNLSLECNCTDTPGSCGLASSTSQCAGNEIAYSHDCVPNQGCDGQAASYCKYDKKCCKVYYPVGCGSLPIPAGGPPATPCTSLPNGATLPAGTNTCPPVSVGSSTAPANCYYGQEIFATQCSSLPVICNTGSPQAASCTPQCEGFLTTVGGVATTKPCVTNGVASNTDLDRSYPYTFVATANDCKGVKCQFYCDTGFTYNVSTGLCECSQYFRQVLWGNNPLALDKGLGGNGTYWGYSAYLCPGQAGPQGCPVTSSNYPNWGCADSETCTRNNYTQKYYKTGNDCPDCGPMPSPSDPPIALHQGDTIHLYSSSGFYPLVKFCPTSDITCPGGVVIADSTTTYVTHGFSAPSAGFLFILPNTKNTNTCMTGVYMDTAICTNGYQGIGPRNDTIGCCMGGAPAVCP